MALSQTDLDKAESIILSTVKEQFPRLETRRGSPFRELIISSAAVGFAVINDLLEKFRKTQSLLDAETTPELVDDSVVDAILSNWFATRRQGSKATGLLKVVVRTQRTYIIREGAEFTTTDNKVFVTSSEFRVSPTPDSEEILELFSEEGVFFFLLPVLAQTEGSAFNVSQDTQFVSTVLGPDLIQISAFTQFSGGTDKEISTNLISRVREEVTVRNLVTRKSLKAVLKDTFSYIQDMFVVGYGDREMLRDKYDTLGIGVGGKVDVYVRTSLTPTIVVIEKTTDANSQFQLSIPGAEVPFYNIISIAKKTQPSALAENFEIEMSTDPNPSSDLNNQVINGRFSIYERATVTIEDSGFASTDVIIRAAVPAGILDIQNFVFDEENRVLSADTLIKAVIPCFTKVYISYTTDRFKEPVVVADLKQAIFDYVNTLPAGQVLSASSLVSICHDFGVKKVSLPILMTGAVLRPDNNTEMLSSSDELEIPTRLNFGMSQNNTVYFITLDDILLSEEVS